MNEITVISHAFKYILHVRHRVWRIFGWMNSALVWLLNNKPQVQPGPEPKLTSLLHFFFFFFFTQYNLSHWLIDFPPRFQGCFYWIQQCWLTPVVVKVKRFALVPGCSEPLRQIVCALWMMMLLFLEKLCRLHSLYKRTSAFPSYYVLKDIFMMWEKQFWEVLTIVK